MNLDEMAKMEWMAEMEHLGRMVYQELLVKMVSLAHQVRMVKLRSLTMAQYLHFPTSQ